MLLHPLISLLSCLQSPYSAITFNCVPEFPGLAAWYNHASFWLRNYCPSMRLVTAKSHTGQAQSEWCSSGLQAACYDFYETPRTLNISPQRFFFNRDCDLGEWVATDNLRPSWIYGSLLPLALADTLLAGLHSLWLENRHWRWSDAVKYQLYQIIRSPPTPLHPVHQLMVVFWPHRHESWCQRSVLHLKMVESLSNRDS